ncbi:hypothetical protein AB1Y20_018156 [Prymnesium parvum]|uniref:Uncharacterized protein n=1 Tax=Prymnesium parvum TaxID=97485 RepID=A0AB34JNH8_PRYPA|eukprot:CAMPEP_0113254744 /NCGR_PEP_ID=MMETSP0008_2-20120614/13866_1 /TAXON_ID=97485 /ORGANISM="Prymnesium parvum" /LENGTH=248 /DNA_ID=CAMNT_0000102985 /DNA_START=12 /DNA_END=758 /DNA_ORIENTATION=+ /assembly_acc=CAM_ASM_000153
MKAEKFMLLPAVLTAVKYPRSVRSVLNYMTGFDTADPAAREALCTDVVVNELMDIWFGGEGRKLDELAQPFAPVVRELKQGTLTDPEWDTLEGKVAKVLLADQLSRSVFRGTAEAFEYDPYALEIVREITSPDQIEKTVELPCAMLYLLPWALAHSEKVEDLTTACDTIDKFIARYPDFKLFSGRNKIAVAQHRDVLMYFGRYPQRNAAFGRTSTPPEKAWLEDKSKLPGWAGGDLNFDAKLEFPPLE